MQDYLFFTSQVDVKWSVLLKNTLSRNQNHNLRVIDSNTLTPKPYTSYSYRLITSCPLSSRPSLSHPLSSLTCSPYTSSPFGLLHSPYTTTICHWTNFVPSTFCILVLTFTLFFCTPQVHLECCHWLRDMESTCSDLMSSWHTKVGSTHVTRTSKLRNKDYFKKRTHINQNQNNYKNNL